MTDFPTARLLRLALPLAAVALIAAGCASSSSSGTQAGGGASTAAGTSAAAPAGLSAAGASAAASTATIKITDGHLTDGAGRTIYLWVADTGRTSTCSGTCAQVWPPVISSNAPVAGPGATASDLTTYKRADGFTQVLYNGHPLYYFEADTAAGDAKGQGSNSFGSKWWEMDASGQAITTAAAPASSAPSSTAAASSSSNNGGYGY